MEFWGPHSTRGAGVKMYKDLNVNSDIVCEIGKWKNQGAFASHYLRLGAANLAASVLNPLAHTVSPRDCAEPEQSRTPGTEDQGGSDWEGEAQDIGEPARPRQYNSVLNRTVTPIKPRHRLTKAVIPRCAKRRIQQR